MKPLCLLLFVGASNLVAQFSDIIAFGDSLTDTGNAFSASFGFVPAPPYFNGRFSNGPNWYDCFAADLGHDSTASFQGGQNYAFGGAQAGDGTFGLEVGTYLGSVSNMADPNALYVAWIGGNDVNNAAGSAGSAATISSALTTFQTDLLALASAGVTEIVVPNLPDLGLVPGQLGSSSAADATALSLQWNSGLTTSVVPALQAAGLTVYTPDIFTAFNNIVANPTAFGFTDSTTEAFSDPGVLAGTVDPNDFVFVDGLHPTEAAHKFLAAEIRQSIPEPSSALLSMLTVLAMTQRRRRG